MEQKKFLDYDGFKAYHKELLKEINPHRIFDAETDFEAKCKFVNITNWDVIKDTDGSIKYVYGLKEGLIVTINNQIWQLVDPVQFKNIITKVGVQLETKASMTAEQLGWKTIGSNADFEVKNHTLQLTK